MHKTVLGFLACLLLLPLGCSTPTGGVSLDLPLVSGEGEVQVGMLFVIPDSGIKHVSAAETGAGVYEVSWVAQAGPTHQIEIEIQPFRVSVDRIGGGDLLEVTLETELKIRADGSYSIAER